MSEEKYIKTRIRVALSDKGYSVSDKNVETVYAAHLNDPQDRRLPVLVESLSYTLTK